MQGTNSYVTRIKPRKAKIVAISKINDSRRMDASSCLVSKPVKLPLIDERRVISEMHIVMGCPPPEDWDRKDRTGTVPELCLHSTSPSINGGG